MHIDFNEMESNDIHKHNELCNLEELEMKKDIVSKRKSCDYNYERLHEILGNKNTAETLYYLQQFDELIVACINNPENINSQQCQMVEIVKNQNNNNINNVNNNKNIAQRKKHKKKY